MPFVSKGFTHVDQDWPYDTDRCMCVCVCIIRFQSMLDVSIVCKTEGGHTRKGSERHARLQWLCATGSAPEDCPGSTHTSAPDKGKKDKKD